MKISLNWLKQYVNLDGASTDELQRAITFLGFEVEGVHTTGLAPLTHVVVGEILTRTKIPNLKKDISLCTVEVGAAHGGVRTIVCGAPNCDPGRRVPVALPGAVLPSGFQIALRKTYGHESQGMMCAADELGLGSDHAGLLLLDPATPIGQPINEALPGGDTVLDIEITPNRPDALSHIGIARELAAWFRRDVTYPAIKFRGETHGSRPDILAAVQVEAPADCPLYIAIALAGVKVGPSPAWMQERLAAVGLRPINNLVDVGNYVMLELGQPLHVFDAKKINGRRLVIRPAIDGEKLTTLDTKERVLNHRNLVIADESRPLVVAGIMGGADAGVDATTTDIVLEAACFRPQSIRATSKRLGLASDSSYRFERGVDPHSTLEAAQRAVDLLLETAGGTVVGPSFQVGGDVPWQREIVVTPAYINEKLGFEIPADDQRAALEALDLVIRHEEPTERRGPAWTVTIPSWRADLDRPIDLVEEVLRVYGTEKVPAAPAVGPALVDAEDAPAVAFNRRVTDYLVGQHFHECVNYTLRSAKELKTWVSDAAVQELALLNPFVEEQSHLRPTLVLGLLESLKLNQSRGNQVSRLCETGRVFVEQNGTVHECAGVGFLLAENPKARSWLGRAQPDFYAVKRHVEIIAAEAGIDLSAQALVPVTGGFWGWQEGQAAAAGDLQHGWTARFGLLNLAMVRAAGVEGKVWAGMFAIVPATLPAAGARRRYQPFSLQPATLRDLALVVDAGRPAEEVRRQLLQVARTAAGTAFAVESVAIFDVYTGTGLPAGKKSLAYALSFRSAERTLNDDEVNGVFAQIQQAIAADGTVSVRA
ncbi:Phenylalanine--tRNA ligase beta subunit [Lacunisphaera limnophila]|uniref:Phenylalanine--tRNA ligase beta subunit n=1 Tax=Lacunisphaera limnophila TaxID=1838286 RepID=A0A1D8AZN2_9BACT|nr:phenylalanine--tRNA ligase subunit beta [Lacunisphaera limnophila]AOS46331.1 Phenylalanine--tRNA ligase beta subunit [Lacunisphaera limnophila]